MSLNKENLIAALKAAVKAAIEADPVHDGGTCNMDSPAIYMPRIRANTIDKIEKESGVKLCQFSWFGSSSWYWVNTPIHGQGDRRTTMMEAALKVLKAADLGDGIKAMGYYQMD